MTSSRIAFIASLVTAASWSAKAVAIGLAGGLDRSPFEGPLFLLGLVCALTAAGAVGVALARPRSRPLTVLSGTAGVVAPLLLVVAVGGIVSTVQPEEPGWVWAEINLWVAAILLVGAGLWLREREPGLAAESPRTPAMTP